jgi:serine/threonine-protein kinase
VRRFAIDLGRTSPIPVMEVHSMVALSPGGDRLVVSLNRGGGLPMLYVRRFDELELLPIEGTDFGFTPFFSPDGKWIGFHDPGSRKLKKVSVDGGPVMTLSDAYPPLGGAWLGDGTIVFSRQEGPAPALFAVDEMGGPGRALTVPEEGEAHTYPSPLPGGSAVLFTRGGRSPDGRPTVDVLDLESGATDTVLENASQAFYVSASGQLLFLRQSAIWVVAFDLDSRSVTSNPIAVQSGLSGSSEYWPWAASAAGQIVYTPSIEGASGGAMRLAWFDREGRVEPLDVAAGDFAAPRISPDGTRLSVLVADSESRATDVWIYHLDGRPPTRLTTGRGARSPIWTPDGTGITLIAERSAQVLTVPSDGSSGEEVLDLRIGGPGGPQSWTPNGTELLYGVGGGSAREGAHTLVVSQDGETRILMDTEHHTTNLELSPDGRWVAYSSNATGGFEVYVRPYPGPGAQHRVSVDGASGSIRWAHDGREIFFAEGRRLMAASFEPGPEPEIGIPVLLFEGVGRNRGFDVAVDGRFLVALPVDAEKESSSRLVLVDGLLEKLGAAPGG